jgi:murein DD-endopeptidase MepM/ murein hydrolase activator NlpD
MRVNVSGKNERILARSAALLMLGGLAAGCSSSAMRFGDATDGLFTGSTANQRQIINDQQAYPGDNPTPPNSTANRDAVQPVNVSGGAVSRGTLAPVAAASSSSGQSLAREQDEQIEAPEKAVARARPVLDSNATGTVASAPDDNIKGWSRAGGTQVTAKEGETVYNLSRRFGVPANIIMQVNGLSEENGLKVGQKLVIPTYVYSAKAGVSAPDNDPKVAAAKSSRGNNDQDAPKPADDKTAVLPKTPKLKESEPQPTQAADASEPKKTQSKGSYTVASGDSLSKIAKKTGVPVAALKEANGLKDGSIRIGQVLKVPNGADANVDTSTKTASIPAADKTISKQVEAYSPPKKADKAIEQAEKDSTDAAPTRTGIDRMRWPVTGRVVSNYGNKGGTKNDGIDISVPKGTPVKAAENGVVIYAGDGLKDFGNTVLVRHENGLVTVYGHASELKVQRGQKVKRGEEIAVSGMSGNANAPKLHFEVRKNSAPVDPKGFLE